MKDEECMFRECFTIGLILSVLDIATFSHAILYTMRGRRGRDRMVVGFITMCAISTYHD
jgi:hypothetical protein